ncbi:hypothetical protein PL8927_690024 [Planktothrix serta PCC 8927]|uniref:Uncharacterized protein n=1 Tax=Planktothrix serta PCC 8927 TaxID=671068 RepID=A0A7Z9BQR5_9CYAN|nr:hypothetical protein PL8927_690024 [Planktothrix serta PCC 8927]
MLVIEDRLTYEDPDYSTKIVEKKLGFAEFFDRLTLCYFLKSSGFGNDL